ncbi:hypothetical protein ACJJIL_07340 [Microbulbifer sp. EKSA005]|uniref:hypothetical protein n=1 Tax=Microbulbifer sp. EKSA005 TaxID=3243364 RepID=UPI004041F21F
MAAGGELLRLDINNWVGMAGMASALPVIVGGCFESLAGIIFNAVSDDVTCLTYAESPPDESHHFTAGFCFKCYVGLAS